MYVGIDNLQTFFLKLGLVSGRQLRKRASLNEFFTLNSILM